MVWEKALGGAGGEGGEKAIEFLTGTRFLSGCLNGGGQIRPAEGETSKELISRLDELYNLLR